MEATPICRRTSAAERRRQRHQELAGFTLLELVVVVLIIAIAAALVLPAVRAGSNQREIRRTLQRFVSVVRRASAMAVLRREHVELWIWPEDGRYALVTRVKPSTDGEATAQAATPGSTSSGPEEDALGDSRTAEASFELPSMASFGEVEGGRLVSERMARGNYAKRDAVLFDFHPVGSSSGGKIELVFDVPPRKQSYALIINPLVSEISMEGDDS